MPVASSAAPTTRSASWPRPSARWWRSCGRRTGWWSTCRPGASGRRGRRAASDRAQHADRTAAPHSPSAQRFAGRYDILERARAPAAWAWSIARIDREVGEAVAIKALRPELGGLDADAAGAVQAGAPAGTPDHPPQRGAHLRPGRGRRTLLHHHGAGARNDGRHADPRRGPTRRAGDAHHRQAGLSRARGGARRGHRPPRHQAAEPAGGSRRDSSR